MLKPVMFGIYAWPKTTGIPRYLYRLGKFGPAAFVFRILSVLGLRCFHTGTYASYSTHTSWTHTFSPTSWNVTQGSSRRVLILNFHYLGSQIWSGIEPGRINRQEESGKNLHTPDHRLTRSLIQWMINLYTRTWSLNAQGAVKLRSSHSKHFILWGPKADAKNDGQVEV